MKNAVSVLLGLFVSSGAASAQTSWAENLFKEGIVHDFGSVPHGTKLYHRFKMTNIYRVPLDINLHVGCNCVTATPSTHRLEPKAEGYIDIIMDTWRFTGPRKVDIRFTVGPQFISTAILQVKANSRADVVLNPGQLNFGVVPRGQKSSPMTLDVEYAGVLDWRITELAPTTAPLDVTYSELYRRPGQVGYRVTVVVKADAPAGQLTHDVYLKTNDADTPLVPILVEASVQASLTVAPNPLTLGHLKVGEALTKLVVIRGTKPYRIVSAEGAGDGLSLELPTQSAPVQIVKVSYQASKAGDVKRQLRFKTDLSQEAQVSVAIEGVIEP